LIYEAKALGIQNFEGLEEFRNSDFTMEMLIMMNKIIKTS